jgi:hypothetical protein
MTGRPLALTDQQLQLVLLAAAEVPQQRRHWFLENIADQLLPREQVEDRQVTAAIEQVRARMVPS